MGIGKYDWGSNRYDTLVDNGDPEHRLDVAIIGDGYARDEMGMFEEDVQSIIDEFHRVEPIRTYAKHFNFHRINIISKQSGVDDRWSKPPIRAKSPLGSHFSFIAARRLVGWDWRVKQVANRSGVPWDSLLVVVNTPRRGGATRFSLSIGYASRNSSDFPRIMIHESGHSIAKLIDEYTGELPDFKFLNNRSFPNLLPFANSSTSYKKPPWKVWIDDKTPCPTPVDDGLPLDCVGAVQGSFYTNYGTYRPTRDCMMRRHSQPFCPVCREQWIKRIYRRTKIADRSLPDTELQAEVGKPVWLDAAVVKPEHIESRWLIFSPDHDWYDGPVTADFVRRSFTFNKRGEWLVICELEDHNPMLRKKNIIRGTRQILQWTINVD